MHRWRVRAASVTRARPRLRCSASTSSQRGRGRVRVLDERSAWRTQAIVAFDRERPGRARHDRGLSTVGLARAEADRELRPRRRADRSRPTRGAARDRLPRRRATRREHRPRGRVDRLRLEHRHLRRTSRSRDLALIFDESRRLLRPGGAFSCRIDLQEHYAVLRPLRSRATTSSASRDRTLAIANVAAQRVQNRTPCARLRSGSCATQVRGRLLVALWQTRRRWPAPCPAAGDARSAAGTRSRSCGVTVLSFVARRA